MSDEADLRGPGVARDDGCNEDEAVVVHCVGGRDVCAVGGPAEPAEECAAWGILEWLRDLRFETPVRRSPDLDCLIIRLRGQELPNGIPTNAFHESLMLIEFPQAFEGIATPDHDL